MEIRDVVHGSIVVEPAELPIIDSRYFQRLRQIKQLGFGEFSYPSATHNRYIHSLGAMETATQAFDTIFGGPRSRAAKRGSLDSSGNAGPELGLSLIAPGAHGRFRSVLRLAALLHDIGHGPLSHTTEFAMPQVGELKVPLLFDSPGTAQAICPIPDRKANHEDYTLKIILDSGLTPLLEKAGARHGFGPKHIAALIEPSLDLSDRGDDFFFETIQGTRIDFRPILQQLISSELDADRMDYLRRDSIHAGVSYGQYDFDWLVGNLTAHVENDRCFLSIQHRALYSFEDFLISRFHMFLMVYFHYKSVVFDEMLAQYFASPDCDYLLPADIEKYVSFNDDHLYAHLATSKNEWARRITDKRPYRMLVELHSGIPAARHSLQKGAEQTRLREEIERDLDSRGIHRITTASTGELSKYFRRPGNPIFVRYDNLFSPPSTLRLEECTDLFQRFSEKRVITRIYVAPEQYAECRDRGRQLPIFAATPAT